MSGFDDLGVFFSDNLAADSQHERTTSFQGFKKRFKEFLKQFHEGDFQYKYREQLKNHYNLGQYWIDVNLADITSFDENLADKLIRSPSEFIPLFESVAKEVADEVTRPRSDDEPVQEIQVMISSGANSLTLRELKSEYIGKLVKVPGIVIAASAMRSKATTMSLQCRTCREVVPNLPVNPGLEGFVLPRKCSTDQTGRTVKCPLEPYVILPDRCKCIDFQLLKLQEAPEDVPHGEMPRHLQLYSERYLCEKVVPGNRVTVTGIYSIKKIIRQNNKRTAGGDHKANVGIRFPYLRVMGVTIDTEGTGRAGQIPFTPEEEEYFRNLAASKNVYDRIAKSIAPSIYGAEDIKKSVACLLFGGSRKRLPDGLARRGDINVLLLGDPGTAKSQMLKFAEKVAPIGVYTSGKGSSAAGLTAAVTRDPSSRNFVMEGGAMVLADGGCVCIDEFDKMREDDRVAIHEAMEQQTISIAKAGITTTLNSRCAVLAAANSVFGRWDDTKAEENIDFMPTILARFDMIYIVKDEHDEKRDATLAQHVMGVHMHAQETIEDTTEGELPLNTLKKFIAFCRARCGPRLSPEAGNFLRDAYVGMRGGQDENGVSKKSTIPITVRQLEAIIRISESLAKMQLKPFAMMEHVREAIRLFTASTLAAAQTGDLAGAEGFTSEADHEQMMKVERQIKRRFPVGSQLPERLLIRDLTGQGFPEKAVQKVLYSFVRRGEIQYRANRKTLFRIK